VNRWKDSSNQQPPRPFRTASHDVFVLLNCTDEVRVRSRPGGGVDEVLELVLSGFEVVERVLEASDFLERSLVYWTSPSCSLSVVMRTLGDRAEVEIHDLSPCEGLGILERYFSRHLCFAIVSAE
jgi:hypothetical protein